MAHQLFPLQGLSGVASGDQLRGRGIRGGPGDILPAARVPETWHGLHHDQEIDSQKCRLETQQIWLWLS